jgi:hypothetical protein
MPRTNHLRQSVRVDTKKGLDGTGHTVIIQGPSAFVIPEILIQGLCLYLLLGFAKVDVNQGLFRHNQSWFWT